MSRELFVFPLSFAQERLWFLDRLVPGNTLYNVDAMMQLRGPLDLEALGRAIDEVVRRHDALRTSFAAIEGLPYQVVSPDLRFPLSVVDLRALNEADRKARAAVLATEETRRPFDLAQGPLLRSTLMRLDEQDALLLLTAHHIIADGWSMGLLIDELSTLYGAFCEQRPSPLPPLDVQYPDFAVWQREWLDGDVLGGQLTYWKRQLRDLPSLSLPTDRARPVVSSFRGSSCYFRLPAALSASTRTLAQREGITLFMLLLGAFQVLLARYTGQADIVVGSPIANRTRAEIEQVIGCFVNTLVLRTNLAGDPTFREALHRVREVALGAYSHQDVPFEKLVEELQPARDISRNPLFQVTFQLQNAAEAPISFPNLVVTFPSLPTETAKFDLAVSLWETSGGELGGRLEYSTDLFDAERIARLAQHYRVLLAAAVAEPSTRVSELPLLTDAERQQLLVEWNRTGTPIPASCVHQWFEAHVERSPEAVAVRSDGIALTYGQLNARANQLAHRLRNAGADCDTIVAVCLDRTPDLIVALLAILKSGAAYVPLDPEDPAERLAFMLRDSAAACVVTNRRMALALPAQVHTARVYVDEPDLSGEPSDNLPSRAEHHHLAYVLYTSGSTGKPKGVLIEHGGLANYVHWVNETLLQRRDLTLPAVTRPTFDACLKQLLAPLTRGHAVWMPPPDALASPERLLEAIAARRDVAMNCVPSLWQAMLDAIEGGRAPAPRKNLVALLLGGERVPPALLERTFRLFPDLECWNLYGPTEVTANATMARLRLDEPITIGRPIANIKAYVLDSHDHPVPIGMPGELVLSGAGIARGYLNRHELTTGKFMRDPFHPSSSDRAFRTGDTVRWRADGTLEFLGRLDGQVKIRGFRIELGEIEAALTSHPTVSEAVVIAAESHDDAQLVAYVVPRNGSVATVSDLRRYLQQTLSEHLVPSVFVELSELPLFSNGKLDRARLPPASGERPRLDAPFVAAGTQLERSVADVWRNVLQLRSVGVHDNFFDLGGRSLLLVRVQAGLRESLNDEVSMIDLFRYPTISTLAGFLQRRRGRARIAQAPGLAERRESTYRASGAGEPDPA
jgi:amino acid adenylation domain-containing protein